MADPQDRAAEVLAAHRLIPVGSTDVPSGRCAECHQTPLRDMLGWKAHAAHVAAALAEAGLLAVRPEFTKFNKRAWDRLVAQLDAARAELAEVKATAEGRLLQLAEQREALADAERRGAVAALRDLADDIDITGYGWISVVAADRFRSRIYDRAARLAEGDDL